MKQETLEEAIERAKEKYPVWLDEEVFILGAKWQQERSYSEEEVFSIIDRVFHMYASSYRQDAKDWFKQFKKK